MKENQKSGSSKVALVTGANRGLGFEVCRQLAQKGCQVILTSRNAQKGEKAIEILKNEGLTVAYYPLDVTDLKSCKDTTQSILSRYGRIDILVNNAGIFLESSDQRPDNQDASLLNSRIEDIRKSMETNVYGAIQMIQNVVPSMQQNRFGRIVNLSSGMGQLSEMNGRWPAYRISKTSINAVTCILADEVKGQNILVNSVCPGWVKTDMGGPDAELTPAEGADTIVWLATLPDGGPSGGFFRERKRIDW